MSDSETKPDNAAADDIIDAEVIEPSAGADTRRSAHKKSSPEKSRSKQSRSRGWAVAGLLLVFIGGLFAAPYARSGLEEIGLLEPQSAVGEIASSAANPDTLALIDTLRAEIERQTIFIGQQETAIAALGTDLAALKRDIEALPATSPPGTDQSLAQPYDQTLVDGLRSDIDKLSEDVARLAALRQQQNPSSARIDSALAVTNAETAALNDRINALESALEAVEAGRLETTPRGRLVLLLSRTKEKAFAGLSFKADLAGLRADLASLPALDQQIIGADLLTLEQSGGLITPFDQLLQGFDEVAAEIVRAHEKSEGSFLQNLFTVRRRDAGATGIDAVLYDAEKKLLVRDIEGAVSAIEGLNGAAKEAASTWLAQAKTHIATRRAFDSLVARIAGRTGAG